MRCQACVYGIEFEVLFIKYEKEGRARKTVPAQKIWYAILDSQIETGGTFMSYKDHANSKWLITFSIFFLTPNLPLDKFDQKNLGTIKSSNLCTEILLL